jgi:hypothetical protein
MNVKRVLSPRWNNEVWKMATGRALLYKLKTIKAKKYSSGLNFAAVQERENERETKATEPVLTYTIHCFIRYSRPADGVNKLNMADHPKSCHTRLDYTLLQSSRATTT